MAANNQYEFSVGEDADIVYKENVTLVSSNMFNETESIKKTSLNRNLSPTIFITRTHYTYEIYIQIKSFKNHSVNIEYEQKGLHSYHTMKLKNDGKQQFIQDGSTIKSNMILKANTSEIYSYTIELIN